MNFPSLNLHKRIFGVIFAAMAMLQSLPVQANEPTPESLVAFAKTADDIWNRRDAAAMSALYATDATSTMSGVALKGRAAVLDYFTNSFKQVPAGMTHRTVPTRIATIGEFIASDNAVFLEVPDGEKGKRVVREFFTFTLLRKTAAGWEMVAVRAIPRR